MKKILWIFSVVSIASFASLDDKIEMGGHVRFRSEANHKANYTSDLNRTLMRIRPYFKMKGGSNWHLMFEPQLAKAFGDTVYVSPADPTQATSGSVYDPSFLVHQGYLDWHITESTEVFVGRQVIAYGDDIIFGTRNWNNTSQSFDAVRFRQHFSDSWVDVFGAKLVENTFGHTDRDLITVYSHWELAKGLPEIEPYLIYLVNKATGGHSEMYAAGVRVHSAGESLDYRAEFTKEWGNGFSNPQDAYQGDAEVGYTLNTMKLRAAVGAFISSSQYFPFFPSPHRWFGSVDVLGRKNLQGARASVSLSPTERTQFSVVGHLFYRNATSTTPFDINYNPIGSANANADHHLGTEVDLEGGYDLGEHLHLDGGVGVFFTGNYLKQLGTFNPVFGYLQLNATI